ncbi:MAG: hypothetical protein E7620_06900 [Ruminococcaceae bacterium]|nr:hypothetical protein [Oscillospiraceae bacterium]
MQEAQKKTEGKDREISDVFTAAEKLVAHTVVTGLLSKKIKESTNKTVKRLIGLPVKLGGMAMQWNLMTDLAGAIDRLLEENPSPAAEVAEEVAEEPMEATEEVLEEAPVEDAIELTEEPEEAVAEAEEAPVEESALEAVAIVEEAPVAADGDEDEDEQEDEESYEGIDLSQLQFIDVMEQPEVYAEMKEREAKGEVRLISRFRRSFRSRMIQSQGDVQEYYSAIKNALLSYKGVKDRTSWDYESFNKGRAKVAKINAKTKTLYLYLALNPEELQGTKYFFDDVSSKKKYAAVPVLMKIKGERKFKHALELIEKLCGEQMALPAVKDFQEQNYVEEYRTTDALVQEGYIKQLTAEIPAEVTGEISLF